MRKPGNANQRLNRLQSAKLVYSLLLLAMNQDTQERVFGVVKAKPRRVVTAKAIAEALGISESEVNEVLKELEKQDKIWSDDLFRPSVPLEAEPDEDEEKP